MPREQAGAGSKISQWRAMLGLQGGPLGQGAVLWFGGIDGVFPGKGSKKVHVSRKDGYLLSDSRMCGGALGQWDLRLAPGRVWNPEALPMEGIFALPKTSPTCCLSYRAKREDQTKGQVYVFCMHETPWCVFLVAKSVNSATPWTVAHQAPLFMGILQARILEWVAMPSCRGSSQPRDGTRISHIAGGFFTI